MIFRKVAAILLLICFIILSGTFLKYLQHSYAEKYVNSAEITMSDRAAAETIKFHKILVKHPPSRPNIQHTIHGNGRGYREK